MLKIKINKIVISVFLHLDVSFGRFANGSAHRLVLSVCSDPLQSIDYEPKAERLSVGSNVTCIGDSNPAPRFSWSAITPSQASPVSGAVLDITEDMLGDNEWMCNAIDDKGQPLTVTVSFVVGERRQDGGGRAPCSRTRHCEFSRLP